MWGLLQLSGQSEQIVKSTTCYGKHKTRFDSFSCDAMIDRHRGLETHDLRRSRFLEAWFWRIVIGVQIDCSFANSSFGQAGCAYYRTRCVKR